MRYPKWVYCAREDVTRANMRQYDTDNDKMWATYDDRYPDGGHNLRERCAILDGIKAELNLCC